MATATTSLLALWHATRETAHARPAEWACTLGALAAAVYLNTLAQAVLDELGGAYFAGACGGALPDLGFVLLPHVPYHAAIDLSAPLLSAALALALWFSTGRLFNGYLRHTLNVQAAVFALRAVALSLTLLPPPLAACAAAPAWVRGWPLVVRPFFVFAGRYTTCHDAFFSGHAANLTIALLAWLRWLAHDRHWTRDDDPCAARHAPLPVPRAAHALVFLYYVAALLLIVMTRFHYTLDVAAAVLVSVAVFYGYFACVHAAAPVALRADACA